MLCPGDRAVWLSWGEERAEDRGEKKWAEDRGQWGAGEQGQGKVGIRATLHSLPTTRCATFFHGKSTGREGMGKNCRTPNTVFYGTKAPAGVARASASERTNANPKGNSVSQTPVFAGNPAVRRALQPVHSAAAEFFPRESAVAKTAPRGRCAANTAFYGVCEAFITRTGRAGKTRKNDPPEKNSFANPCFYGRFRGVLSTTGWVLGKREKFEICLHSAAAPPKISARDKGIVQHYVETNPCL